MSGCCWVLLTRESRLACLTKHDRADGGHRSYDSKGKSWRPDTRRVLTVQMKALEGDKRRHLCIHVGIRSGGVVVVDEIVRAVSTSGKGDENMHYKCLVAIVTS